MHRQFLLFHLVLLFLLSLTGCALKSGANQGATSGSSKAAPSPRLQNARTLAFQLVMKQDFEAAIIQYQQAREYALKEGNSELAIQFLNNIAACYQSISAYREAMGQHRKALEEAKFHKLKQWEGVAVNNIASLLLEMGDVKSAADLLLAYPLDASALHPEGRLASYLLQMNVFTRLGRAGEARLAFERALKESTLEASPAVISANKKKYEKWPESLRELKRAWVFAAYSQALVRLKNFEEAEKYSLEAFRLRSIFQEKGRLRDALELAVILRHRNDLHGASLLLQVARSLDPSNRTPMHLLLMDREEAQISLAKGDFGSALPALRRVMTRARAWRMEVLPSDAAFLNFEVSLNYEIQNSFLSAMTHSEFSLDQPEAAAESFWIAEEARFASMRASQFPASDLANRLPSEYWSTLSSFRKLQMANIPRDTEAEPKLLELERKLHVIEMQAGLNIPQSKLDGAPKIKEWIQSLSPDEVVFSFYLAEPYSLAWTATRKGITARRIASRQQLMQWVTQFRKEIQDPSQNGNSSTGMELSKQLFGEDLYAHRTTPFWTMVLDQELSTLPIAALPTNRAGTQYLVQDHSLRVLPSAIFLQTEASQQWNRQAVGIGDAVYNQADRRLTPLKNISFGKLELNRLPASAKELRNSLNTIKNQSWLVTEHTGVSATVETLETALRQSPDILHLSTHFVPQVGSPNLLNIAMSPAKGPSGTSLFSSLDLNAVRTQTKLVVLSGCNSSTGEVISGIGINGLSRAFLISGVSTVVATLWPTEDTDGPIFPAFYQELIQQKWSPRAAAESLRAAQLKMIRQGGWTSKPSYWAAYLAISKG
ncbi:MAG: CHAT domain-containing tetratricopeptide repeat protein [Acidobacteria bacterium]|nr:CHAT domain-containing tetratricopeptide repeat protein [Acidobacteriota bacterium]